MPNATNSKVVSSNNKDKDPKNLKFEVSIPKTFHVNVQLSVNAIEAHLGAGDVEKKFHLSFPQFLVSPILTSYSYISPYVNSTYNYLFIKPETEENE